MLKIEQLYKKYPGERLGAVVDVSFQLGKGEVLAVVGRSGSGKSTLLRMISGLMKPDSGQVLFNDEPLKDPEEQLIAGHDKIKMVFQDFQVKPNMTVAENVKYKLLHFNKEYQEERTVELLNTCGLSALSAKKPHELSGGQQQRLSLARALADDPELLLMDEPFSNLDPIIKEDLFLELSEIVKKEQISLILVSHDIRDALLIAGRLAYINEGAILQIGTPEDMYKKPKTLEVAQFFGRVNQLEIDNKTHYIRAEDIHPSIASNQLKVTIENCTFMGSYYLCSAISIASQKLVFHSNEIISKNSSIKVGYNSNSLLHFSVDKA